MNVLVVSPDFPYPPNHGGRVDIWGRLQTLAKMGCIIDLAVTSKITPKPGELEAVQHIIRKLWLMPRQNRWWYILSNMPVQQVSRLALSSFKLESTYDVVLLETEYVEPILRNPSLKAHQIWLRLQNDESTYFRQLASSTNHIAKRLYYLSEAFKLGRLSSSLYKKVDQILFISEQEFTRITDRYPNIRVKSSLLPAPLTRSQFATPGMGGKVLFVGSLFMPNNKQALVWYLRKVHPLINDPRYNLVIAGNSRGENLDWLRDLVKPYTNVELYDSPLTLDKQYAESSIFINPMHLGAGVKLKSVEAIQNGLALVTTQKGIEGTGLEAGQHFLLADTAPQFAEAVKQLLNDVLLRERLVLQGQAFLRKRFDHQAILEDKLGMRPAIPRD